MTTTPPDITPAALPVLLIEDEPAVMAYVRATLERSGYSGGVHGIWSRGSAAA